MNEILSCYGLSKRYDNGHTAIDNITINLNAGKIIGLLGPNGSGKTTLIKMACGLLTPTAGTITVDGMPIGPQTKAIVSYLPDDQRYALTNQVNQAFVDYVDHVMEKNR